MDELLFEKHPTPMLICDLKSHEIKKVNSAFTDLYTYEKDEIESSNFTFSDLQYSENGAGDLNESSVVEPRSYFENGMQQHQTKNGDILHIEVRSEPFTYKQQEARLVVFTDVSEQKKIEEDLKNSLQEKQVLIEEVHHRVKNNLAVISGLLQMQTLHVDDPQLTKYIQNSQLRIQSMSIVHEMLYKSQTLSKIQMRGYVEKLSTVIADTLCPDDKDIDIITESDAIELNVNQAIPSALIISELITNAFEFAFEGREEGTIWVKVLADGNMVTASVKDDGIGLPENFEEMRTKSLGISLMENLCAQLETEIEIDSGDWGTKFSFTFEKNEARGSSSSNRI